MRATAGNCIQHTKRVRDQSWEVFESQQYECDKGVSTLYMGVSIMGLGKGVKGQVMGVPRVTAEEEALSKVKLGKK